MDGQFGIQGSFAKDDEGKQGGGSSGGDNRNHPGNWGGDRDGDGVPNIVDFDDGVGWADINKSPGSKPSSNNGGGGGGNSGGGSSRGGNRSAAGERADSHRGEDKHPIILDLDGTGVELTELQNSTVFVDASGDGLLNRTAWAAAGNGVLFFDADRDGTISETREYVFTEWDPTATSDIEALRAIADTNGDGVFDANDAAWSDFKVLVTNADGTLETKTLDELGITSIDLTADATNIELPDGSVITGKTTFTYADGSTGTVADTTLVSDTASYRIEETESTDASGTRTHVQTGYESDGMIAFVITSETTADGSSITNSYDVNGDGIVDRIQTIETVTNPDGSKSETITNKVGSDFATGILISETKTTTSADDSTVTIERDSTGGGWYDQTEVRTTHADDSMTIVTTDQDPNGGVIRSSTETVSADGLTRTDAIDEDGDGAVDLTITHVIVVNADGSRSETIEYFNQDGSLRSSVTESVSADGQTKTITRDLDGDGDVDVQEDLDIVVNADFTTDSTITVKNGDGSIRSSTTQNQSADAFTKTSAVDQDGDGDVDLTTVEATTINTDGSRETETTLTNTDGSARGMTKVTLGSDQVSSETWIDHNQDGTFQATDLSQNTSVDGVTGERSTTSWTRNADGSFSAQSVSVTSEDGLVVSTDVDADGDGDTDLSISDVTVENADGTSTQTIIQTAQDGALVSEQVVTTSADGLTITTLSDIDGDGGVDGKSVSSQVSNADGSTLTTVTSYAGDQTTLLGQSTTSQSADRRLTITTSDANGDGATDATAQSEKHADGSMTELETRFSADGTTLFTRQTDVSADGLTVTVATDLDGDGDTDVSSTQTTVLNADGGRTTTSTVHNGDNSLRGQTVTTISDDRLVVTTSEDTDGNGTSERSATSTTELLADGSQKTTEDVQSSDGTLLARTETTVSDDGLTAETRFDNDGDQGADIATSSVTVLNDDGSVTVTTDVNDTTGASDVLRSQVITTTSDNGRDILETTDINGDGNIDMRVHRVVGDDGQVTLTETELNSDGSLQSQMVATTNDNGLQSSTQYDMDGNGAYERRMDSTTVLNGDGSTTQVVEEKSEDGTVYRRSVTDTSRDGWTTTTREDWDNDGDDDLTTSQTYDLSAAGIETTTVTRTAADGSTLSADTNVTSADGRSSTRSIDLDGNGVDDMVTTASIADDGSQASQGQYFDATGTLVASRTSIVSGDGLTTTSRTDRDGDGTDELVATATSVLGVDGSQSVTVDYTDGSGVQLAKTVATSSDDGLSTSWSADYNGDGTNEFVTTGTTVFETDGDVVQTATTVDGSGTTTGTTTATTSGDGLTTSVIIDADGDGTTDRTSDIVTQASGAWTQTEQQFGANSALVHAKTTSQSADAWTRTTSVDNDGDGASDRDLVSVIDEDRNRTSTWRDLNMATAALIITGVENANGSEMDYAFDLDGDGQSEIIRETNISFDASGARVTEFTESHGSRMSFEETVTSSFDGLSQSVETDVDGDGDTDVTQVSSTTLHDDGRQTLNVDTTYADGSVRSALTRVTSADGRTVTETRDHDGDGNDDVVVTSTTAADGSYSQVEESFDAQGDLQNTRTTTVSADGLVTTIATDETSLTIDRSPIGNGSYETVYTSDDLSFTSSHEVDGAGIETWFLNRTVDGVPSSFEVRLTVDMKARLFNEAERLYDTVLDRDLDRSEIETLIVHVQNGELSIESLADELMQSDEFTMRYSDLSDASFVTQVYLNTFGRGANLDEFADALASLSDGTTTRAELAADLSESSEHIVVGNGHMSSNNFDVFLNPAKAERSIDKAYLEDSLARVYEVLHGTDANEPYLELAAYRIMEGLDTPLSTTELLMAQEGQWLGNSGLLLTNLSSTEFVTQLLENAFGTAPTAAEVQSWTQMLDDDQLTRSEFALMIARSPDYKAARAADSAALQMDGTGQQDLDLANVLVDEVRGDTRDNDLTADGLFRNVTLSGGEGNDVLRGGAGNDNLSGGAGVDTLDGGAGNDIVYFDSQDQTVTGGDGHDTAIAVGAIGVNLILATAGFEAAYGSTGDDTLEGGQYSNIAVELYGRAGHDLLRGSSGDDMLVGGTGNDQIGGKGGDDSLFGGEGDDRLYGEGGEDLLVGGVGDDLLDAGGDDDQIFGGDGADNIFGKGGDDYIDGGDGDDTIDAGEYDDVVFGGSGNDTINASGGDDYVDGGDGDDVIRTHWGDDWVLGGAGDDTIHIESWGDKRVEGGDGDDIIYVSVESSAHEILGGKGTDRVHLTGDRSEYVVTFVQNGSQGIGEYRIVKLGDSIIHVQDVEEIVYGDGEVQSLPFVDSNADNSGSFYLSNPSWANGAQHNGQNHWAEGNNPVDWWMQNGDDTVQLFGTHNDTVRLQAGDDAALLGGGNDTAYGGGGHDFVDGQAGNDTIYGESGNDRLEGGDGADIINGGNGEDVVLGGAGDDVIDGHYGSDDLSGDAGNDIINGEAGSDKIDGGDGDDILRGGIGADTVDGGTGLDEIYGGDGADHLSGGSENDVLWGDNGDDTLRGDEGNDTLDGGFGNDTLNGGLGNDQLTGGHGFDRIYGDDGDDTLLGGDLDDWLDGGADNDTLSGETGKDTLSGGDGNDLLNGGAGTDFLIGGAGSDTFVFGASSLDGARDYIADFSATDVDLIDLSEIQTHYGWTISELNAAIMLSEDASGTELALNTSSGLIELAYLENVTEAELSGVLGINVTPDVSADEDGNLAVTAPDTDIVGTEASTVQFDVSGIDADATAVVTVTDGTNSLVSSVLSADGSVSLDLSGLSDGALIVSVTASDDDGNSATVAGPGLLLDTNPGTPLTGTANDDTLIDAGAGTEILGLDGNDSLSGNGGADILDGGAGADDLIGGAGADVFRFTPEALDGNRDDILDFSVAEGDMIDLSLIADYYGADPTQAANAVVLQAIGADTQISLLTPDGTYDIALIHEHDPSDLSSANVFIF